VSRRRSWDDRPQGDQWITKAQVIIVGMLLVEAVNVALVLAHMLDWPNVLPILILCAAIQVAAVSFLTYATIRR